MEKDVVVKFPGKFVGARKPPKGKAGKGSKDNILQATYDKYLKEMQDAITSGITTGFIGAMRTEDGSVAFFNAGFTPLESLGLTKLLDDITTSEMSGIEPDFDFTPDDA